MGYTDGNGQPLTPVTVQNPSDYPMGAIPLTASGQAAAAANNQTLAAGGAAMLTFITGFEITGGGATAASIVDVSVTGTVGGTMFYAIPVPAGATAAVYPLVVDFPTPIPASANNTAIVVNVPSFGAGNTRSAVTVHGYQIRTVAP